MTATQAKIAKRIEDAGYRITQNELIGRRLFIAAEKSRGNIFLDEWLLGTVGPNGKIDMKWNQVGVRLTVTEDYQLACRLGE